ncbi:MAG: serine/threonine protein kinase [Planctomycetes bacterium]|nr:serine/threonine protein kinase [Planctomycetota bacterium]
MPDPPLQPGSLDRLAREVGKERAKSGAAKPATAFGWSGSGAAPARIGRFQVTGPLGRGGMGVVYHAIDPKDGREVALKSLAAGPGERLRREGEAIARLDHPGIVKILDTGEEGGRPFFVMELVHGRPLDEAWAGWDLRRRVEAVERIARAVAHAHGRGVAHRDLKPGNVLVGEDGAPRVTDFGLAAVEDARTKLTDPGTVMGTPAWMSPEQVRGDASGPPADTHALGSLLYLALTGTVPFEAPNPPAIYRKILDEEPAWPRKRAPQSPPALEAVCLAALEKEPARRPTAEAIAEDLARWLEGKPVHSRLPTLPARLLKRAGRNPLAWLGLCAAAAALVVGSSALAVQSLRHARQERARDLSRDAQPLAAQALLALQAGDDATAARLMADFQAKMAAARALDASAEGGWFEIAEYRRCAGDEDGAWEAVDAGLAARPGESLLRLEKGLLLAARFRREARRVEREADTSSRAGGPPEVPASAQAGLDFIRAVTTAELDAGIVGLGGEAPPSARVARAELALLSGNAGEAERLVAGLEQPEAKVVAGQVAEARGNLDAALGWYSKAVATRERHWPAWEARAAARERLAGIRWKPGETAGTAEQSEAIADWEHLAGALPRRGDLQTALATACVRLATIQVYAQADPTAPCRRAITACTEALRLNPKDGEALLAEGRAWAAIAGNEAQSGKDARTSYDAAVRAFDAAAAQSPDALDVRIERAGTFRMRGYWRRSRKDAAFVEDYERSLLAWDDVLRLNPAWLPAWSNKALIDIELERWGDAVKAFEQSGRWATEDPGIRAQFEEAKRRAAEKDRR